MTVRNKGNPSGLVTHFVWDCKHCDKHISTVDYNLYKRLIKLHLKKSHDVKAPKETWLTWGQSTPIFQGTNINTANTVAPVPRDIN